MKTVIHWFRRDLRITDNRSLEAAASGKATVIPVYVLGEWHSPHRWTGPQRQGFLCGSLGALDGNLRAIGSKLTLREGDATEALLALAAQTGATEIHFNRDPDPFGRAVEARLASLAGRRLNIVSHKDVCLHEGQEVLTASGDPFRVFTPYAKAWWKLPRESPGPRIKHLPPPPPLASLPLPELSRWGLAPKGTTLEPGERAARARLSEFLKNGLATYGARRDFPGLEATSRLSQDLRFGLLSIREVFAASLARAEALPAISRANAEKFLSELIWREFYMAILHHFPGVLENEFNPAFRGMRWPGKRSAFARWRDGETGFPIVDAAMRELAATGFMHNRARMITAMFLTKDLHLDWRSGESHFMQNLADGEIASNNGGWQWSAGTGADAAPYFRIQNPWTQTSRYDPDGSYIKKWIPELREVPARAFCAPPPDGKPLAPGYPAPIVDHAEARETALALFASHKRRA